MENKIIKNAMLNACLAALYVALVATLLYSFGHSGKEDSVIIPIMLLLLFVFSAAFTGKLIVGRPIIWYLDGRKKEALSLLAYTLGIFLLITLSTIIFFLAMYV